MFRRRGGERPERLSVPDLGLVFGDHAVGVEEASGGDGVGHFVYPGRGRVEDAFFVGAVIQRDDFFEDAVELRRILF